jgi:hypothetical protein
VSGHVVERLSPFLDGEVQETERREIQSHLEGCADCAAYLADLAAVDAVARGLDVVAPAGYFEALPGRVRQRLRGRQPRRLPVWGWAAAAALLIAVLLPKLSYVPSPPQPAPTLRAPAAPAPTSGGAARELAPQPVTGPMATPPPSRVLEEARPATKRAPRAEEPPAFSGGVKSSAPSAPARRDEPRPGGTLARDAEKTEAVRAPMQDRGYVTPPATAAVPPATTPPEPEARVAAESEEQKLQKPSPSEESAPRAATGAVSRERRKQAFEEKGLADANDEDAAGSSAPRSVPEARALRERARERARRHPGGAEGDAARLQIVEAGARAYELEGDPRDLEILRQDAEAYLQRRDARHPDRVRDLLRSLGETP